MAWNVEFSQTARRQFRRIDKTWQRRLLNYLEDEVANLVDPRIRGTALKGDFSGLWRYRIGDYRAICQIQDETVTILIVEVGHRSSVYR